VNLTAEHLSDPWWRLNHLYRIITDDAVEVPFVANDEQANLYRHLWYWNLVLKARQLGFTTFIDLLLLDQCLWVPNFSAAIIAHNLDDAGKIFRNKVKYPYDHLPPQLKEKFPCTKETDTELVFANGSNISVTTSARSGTIHGLHVSEMGKIARKFPEKAREIVTGSFNAVPAGGLIFVESTAEGAEGWFHDHVMKALRRRQQGATETAMDFRLHFYPWYTKPTYATDPTGVHVSDEMREYFAKLKQAHGIDLSPQQQAWYVSRRESNAEDTKDEDMKREFPATPEEAFSVSTMGSIFGRTMEKLRRLGRIGHVDLRAEFPVFSAWDFGVGANNYIWIGQRVGSRVRWLKTFRGSSEDGLRDHWERMEKWRQEVGARWSKHYLPHDARTRIQGYEVKTREDILYELGMRGIVVVSRIDDIATGIDMTRSMLADCEFDEDGCEDGISCLDNYKYEWDETTGRYSRNPKQDRNTHGADAVRQYAQRPEDDDGNERSRPASVEQFQAVGGTY
jgi:hypothetical protein